MPRVFRLPRLAYLVVLLLVFGVTPLVQHPAAAIVYVVPVVVAFGDMPNDLPMLACRDWPTSSCCCSCSG